MNCNLDTKDATYGSELFCKACGMNFELDTIMIHHKGTIELYCCDDCAKIK